MHRSTEELPSVDVAVIGGGPAGLAAALWAARYRRRVLLIDGGRPRNAPTTATHGYLGTDGASPWDLISCARKDLLDYPEVTLVVDAEAIAVEVDADGFEVVLDDDRTVRALRLILATGVVDELPRIDRFKEFFGSCAFTCPTCDGYEAQNKTIVVIGDHQDFTAFAVGLLDWATTITIVVEATSTRGTYRRTRQRARLGHRRRHRHTRCTSWRRWHPRGCATGRRLRRRLRHDFPARRTPCSTATWQPASAVRSPMKDAWSWTTMVEPRFRTSSPPET